MGKNNDYSDNEAIARLQRIVDADDRKAEFVERVSEAWDEANKPLLGGR